MRVTNRLAPRDESGAVLVVVALVLTALFGMTVLVVDVGGLLGLRRQMVTAADSAALAAAQSCASEQTGASFQADLLAKANVPETTRAGVSATGCGTRGAGTVAVSYTAPKELYFAPILGTPKTATVASEATAKWGPSAGATPAPIALSFASTGTSSCLMKQKGQVCGYWHDYSLDDLTETDHFGFVNLGAWGVAPLASCRNADRQLAAWISGATKVDTDMVSGGPTYACLTSGRSRRSSILAALQSRIGDTLQLPVSDASGVVTASRREKFDIAGFVPLEVVDAMRGDDPRAIGTPGASGRCEVALNLRRGDVVFLESINRSGCPSGRSVDSISNLELSPRRGRPYVEGTDYTYNPAVQAVTWRRGGSRRRVEVSFDWSITGSPGLCGLRSANSSGVCLVARFNRPQIGGRLGAPAEDFGLRAIGLQE